MLVLTIAMIAKLPNNERKIAAVGWLAFPSDIKTRTTRTQS